MVKYNPVRWKMCQSVGEGFIYEETSRNPAEDERRQRIEEGAKICFQYASGIKYLRQLMQAQNSPSDYSKYRKLISINYNTLDSVISQFSKSDRAAILEFASTLPIDHYRPGDGIDEAISPIDEVISFINFKDDYLSQVPFASDEAVIGAYSKEHD